MSEMQSGATTAEAASTPAESAQTEAMSTQEGDTQAEDLAAKFKGTKHKVKVDDQEIEVDYDELISDYQRKEASNRRFREASEIETQVFGMVEALKSGDHETLSSLMRVVPKEVLKNYATEVLLAELEYEELPEAERKARDLEKENKALKEDLEREAAAKQQQEWNRQVLEAGKEIERDVETFFAETGCDRNPVIIARLSEFLLAEEVAAAKSGGKRNIKRAYDRTIKTLQIDARRYVHSKTAKDFLKEAPPKLVEELKKYFVEEGQSLRRFDNGPSDGSRPAQRGGQKPKKLGFDEWFANKEQQLRGR